MNARHEAQFCPSVEGGRKNPVSWFKEEQTMPISLFRDLFSPLNTQNRTLSAVKMPRQLFPPGGNGKEGCLLVSSGHIVESLSCKQNVLGQA